jgi:hypothetical protein
MLIEYLTQPTLPTYQQRLLWHFLTEKLGNTIPTYFGGFNSSLTYKDFDLGFFS